MLTSNHIIMLILCAVLIIIATFLSVKNRLSSRKASVIFFVICVLSEITKDMINMVPSKFGGYILDHDDIPLHLCSLTVFAMLFIVFTKNKNAKENILCAVTTLGVIAPILALLLPTEGVAFDKVITYQYFIYHSALMWFALHNIITGSVDMGVKAYKRNLLYLSILIFFMLYINSAFSEYDVNFCFLRKPPVDGVPVLNLNHGWYFYFAVILILSFGSVTLVHLPFILREIKKEAGEISRNDRT